MNSIQRSILDAIVNKFPQMISFAVAYGSAIFPQSSSFTSKKHPVQCSQTDDTTCKNLKGKVVDFIFGVEDSLSFHRENMKCNPSHYSFLKYAGAETVKSVQEGFGGNIYYNSLVKEENTTIKYGVISMKHLVEDLLDWQTLYVSGRLHKPVLIIKKPESTEVMDFTGALNTNLQSALHVSLLCLPESFSEEQLFLKIVGLSYNGDFRMYFGEDKNKIKNIVKNQMNSFRTLYEEKIKIMPHLHWRQSQGIIEQDCSFETTLHHLNLLPKRVQHNILVIRSKDGRYRDIEDVLQVLAYDTECSEIVERAVRNIVVWPSITQSVKGIMTAGLVKSLKYSSSKLKKMVKSISDK